MVKNLLPKVPRYFKANLHTHSTISDGKLTPEEARDAYKAEGYSILAMTDHSVMVSHQDLNTEDFLMITGVEIDWNDKQLPDSRGRDRHMCLLSKDPHRQWIPFRDPAPKPASVPYEAVNEIEGMPWEYDADSINAVIEECNRQGMLVTYNHPGWSLENYADYAPMKGLWGMEYRNGCGWIAGHDGDNGQVYQDFLLLGNRMVPICADDMHRRVNKYGFKALGVAWTMIGARELTYDSVMQALEQGDLYSSCGPQIYSLTWEDGVLKTTCSPCWTILVVTQSRVKPRLINPQGQTVTEASFDMTKWLQQSQGKENAFFRLIYTDCSGNYAVTRAYFLDEL